MNGVAFSPDGKTLATVGFDTVVRLWGVQDGNEILALTGNQAPITSVDISPDGKQLVTGSADGSVRVYALDIEDLMELARQRLTRRFTDQECQKFLHMDACPLAP